MTIEIGPRIRELRLRHNITQEQLATSLNLTAQSVSKWETGVTMPDIQLLPELSMLLGVRIDELFSLTEDARYARIENMLRSELAPSAADMDAAESFLQDRLRADAQEGRALTLLAGLHNRRAAIHRGIAERTIKRALELEPERRENHSILCEAFGGVVWDWCLTNHHEQIAYYQAFVARHPAYHRGYLWLLENLLADNRIEEARRTVERMRGVEETYHVPLYLGRIAAAQGDMAAAEAHWQRMVEAYPEDGKAWSARGDAYARLGRYPEAIDDYRRAIDVQAPPRYIDDALSIAHISEIVGDWAEAARSYERVLAILREDWGRTDGDAVARYEGLAKERRWQAAEAGRREM